MKRRSLPKKYAEILVAAASDRMSETSDGDGMR
jgi:hypothetical protein